MLFRVPVLCTVPRLSLEIMHVPGEVALQSRWGLCRKETLKLHAD